MTVKRYEYRVYEVRDGGPRAVGEGLSVLGADGWRVVELRLGAAAHSVSELLLERATEGLPDWLGPIEASPQDPKG